MSDIPPFFSSSELLDSVMANFSLPFIGKSTFLPKTGLLSPYRVPFDQQIMATGLIVVSMNFPEAFCCITREK
jgi:hypothetical protein